MASTHWVALLGYFQNGPIFVIAIVIVFFKWSKVSNVFSPFLMVFSKFALSLSLSSALGWSGHESLNQRSQVPWVTIFSCFLSSLVCVKVSLLSMWSNVSKSLGSICYLCFLKESDSAGSVITCVNDKETYRAVSGQLNHKWRSNITFHFALYTYMCLQKCTLKFCISASEVFSLCKWHRQFQASSTN